jgi:hypothetical protein
MGMCGGVSIGGAITGFLLSYFCPKVSQLKKYFAAFITDYVVT